LRGALIGCASDFGGGHPSRNAAGLPPSTIRSWIGSYRVRRAAGSVASRGNTIRLLIPFLLFLLALPASGATVYEGKVVHIADGDTLTILWQGKPVKVRLAEIDTPEKRQPFGMRAKQALAGLAFSKRARVIAVAVDRYRRTVGKVYVGGVDVNATLVRAGYAWVYRRYAKDPRLYEFEKLARAEKRGLWADAHPIPPWEWRHGKKTVKRRKKAASGTAFTCGTKRYCREMTSCKEARFYLKRCGLRRLDGDGDGVPCAKLCR